MRNHVAKVVVARPVASLPDGYFTPEQNALEIEGLQIAFTVEASLTKEPNPTSIVITNLSESARTAVEKLPLFVYLYAGYADEGLSLLAQGDCRTARSKIVGVNWQTSILLGDGTRASNALFSKAYGKGIDKRTVLADLASTMGLKIPKNLADAKELAAQFANGATFHGPSRKQLSTLLDRHGYTWSIQKGELVAQKQDETTNVEILVNESTGMVETPDFGTPTEPGKPPHLSLKSLLDSRLVPGRRIRVESRSINGSFKTLHVKTSGDTLTPTWFTEIEAMPL